MMIHPKLPHYTGSSFSNPDYADGQLPHAIGASSYQVMRANRAHPELSDGKGNTYNHAPMITFWKGKFYLQYLSNPVDEHTLAGCSFLSVSEDGVNWSFPIVSFPEIKAPEGVYHTKDGETIVIPEARDAIMHQRMAFFHSSEDRLLVTGFYGHVTHHYMCPWGNYGIGRAVREIYEDGTLGPVYFIRIMEASGWTEEKLPFPLYSRSDDPGFISACDELLSTRLYTQQWAEEHGDNDELIHIKNDMFSLKGNASSARHEKRSSFTWYHIDEKNIVGLWKHGVVGRSEDGGDTWMIAKEPSFATSGAKSWGQKTDDGKYAIFYVNSIASEHRYPLAVVTSDDGIAFDGLAAVAYEVPPRRYDGLFKDYGPQYIRGLSEGHKEYPKDNVWLCHSLNKEDIWVTRIPVPIRNEEMRHVDEDFSSMREFEMNWNVHSPILAPVRLHKLYDKTPCLSMSDCDPIDYARAERNFKAGEKVSVTLSLLSSEWYEDKFYIELTDKCGNIACRLVLGDYGTLYAQTTSVMIPIHTFEKHLEPIKLSILADAGSYQYSVSVNAKTVTDAPIFMRQKVNELSRIVLRTKPSRKAPGVDNRPDTPDMENCDTPSKMKKTYYILSLKTDNLD